MAKRKYAKVKAISLEFRESISRGLMDLRNSLLTGGRSEVMLRYYEIKENERLMYVDVNSLYPHTQRFFDFPIQRFYCLYGHWLPKKRLFRNHEKKS